MFKISKRKGSSLWQVRKRWPTDVAPLLKGEFTRSTGESDRKLAEAKLPRIAAEYVAFVEDQAVEVVGEVGAREFGLSTGNADGADEQAIAVFLMRKDMLDPCPDR
ncbi:MAG: hypothetical protein ACK4E5_01195 [Erythrobacter cryptus]